VIAVLVFSLSLAPWWSERLSQRMQPLVVLLPALLVWLLGVEVAASAWKLPLDEVALVRWLGWLPLAAGWLWLCERVELRRRRPARG
jgi:hypothetical protein